MTLKQLARELNKMLDTHVQTTDCYGDALADKLLLTTFAAKHDKTNGYEFVCSGEYCVSEWFRELLYSYGYFAEFRDYDTLAIYRI